ncbi:Intramolecular chaperone auto-processing domain containing protein [uncultured Caudovirales phage]|uniref:Intramolecular chaperone auto-processing domain containing protein n=1 Tax=uncultured Caudovirales phage TaxID=2100421 RepID=A0A6J5TAV8_9CAUD|nr:Intramolecular chaperone auto-processing domain containing protein [uncultured Caudovirales phage]CAB5187260.1 Intramolecular chaperone auto-processing domain containing protein [uncultured Caudovirales phage]
MAFVTADRVSSTSTTTGTGSITVSATTPTGYKNFSAVLSVSDTFYYCIDGGATGEWETGVGTYSSANVFARTTVLASSAAGAKVSFSSGTKSVYMALDAAGTLQTTPGTIGASAITVLSTGSTTARTLAARFAEVAHVKDFGAACNGTTDDTAAVQAAINSLTIGGTVTGFTGPTLINSTLTIKPNVTLQGPVSNEGLQNLSIGSNYATYIGSLILNGTATIYLDDAAAISGFYILNKSLQGALPFANVTVATAAVAAFSGTAITALGPDVKVSNCWIAGFSQAFYSSNYERTKIEWVEIDCTAGIWIDANYDIPRISSVHCWPFLTTQQSWTTAAVNCRSGIGFNFTTEADGLNMVNCFAYGYQTGYHIGCGIGASLSNCFDDGPPNIAGQYGYVLDSTVSEVAFSNCNSQGKQYGFYINNSAATATLTGCVVSLGNTAGTPQHITLNSHLGVIIDGCYFQGLSGSTAITVAAGTAGKTNILGCIFGYGVAPYSIPASQFGNINIWSNRLIAGSTDGTIGMVMSTDSTEKQSWNRYAYNAGGNGPATLTYSSRGSVASPTASQAGDLVWALEGYGSYGTGFRNVGKIRLQVDNNAVTSSNSPGAWVLSTTPIGSTTTVDRIALNNGGAWYPLTDNAYLLGGPGARWSAVWAANGTIQTSDQRQKTDIATASLGLDFINELNPVSYKWVSGGKKVSHQVYRDENGNEVSSDTPNAKAAEIISEDIVGKRTHWGLLAQQVKTTCDKYGVDFAGWVLSNTDDPSSEQGLRYDQFVSPIIKAIQELSAQNAALKIRLAALEVK